MILRLEGGKNFIIRAEGLSEENKYVKGSHFLNGKELKRFRIFHHEITDGGILEFIMTDNPSNHLINYESIHIINPFLPVLFR